MSDPTPEQLPTEPDEDEEGRPVSPEQPMVDPDDPGAPKTPPGHEAEPGRRREGAPGQNKPRPDNTLPEE